MAAKKGHEKWGGRKKDSKNKKTLILDTFAKTIVEGGMEKFQTELMQMKGNNFVYAYMTLFEYVKPKLARTEITGEDGKEIKVKWVIPNSKDENN